jgi:hypothetical protein
MFLGGFKSHFIIVFVLKGFVTPSPPHPPGVGENPKKDQKKIKKSQRNKLINSLKQTLLKHTELVQVSPLVPYRELLIFLDDF